MSSPAILDKYLEELRQPSSLPLKQGDAGIAVRRMQEWLTLHGWKCASDGDFGPATQRALQEFQLAHNLQSDGLCDIRTYSMLVMPLIRACKVPDIAEKTFGEMVVRVAMQFQKEHPVEVGGDNRGPWQRHFSRGRESQPWCQDFASTCWFDAARLHLLNTELLPFDLCDDNNVASSYVPWVVTSAKNAGQFMKGVEAGSIPPGSMFFVPGIVSGRQSHVHVGIVLQDDGVTIKTVEGNTNDDGSPNGYEVAIRFRPKAKLDFGICEPRQVTLEKTDGEE